MEEQYEDRLKRYSLEELCDARDHIDKQKLPERYQQILDEIEKRAADKNDSKQKLEAIREGDRYRTFWLRYWAAVIDGLILLPITLFYFWFMKHCQAIPSPVVAVIYIMSNLVFHVYNVYYLGSSGQTPGKRVMKIKVLDEDEMNHISYTQAIRRYSVPILMTIVYISFKAGKILAGTFTDFDAGNIPEAIDIVMYYINTIWFMVELITMLFNKRRRAVHDYIANSVVVSFNAADNSK